jgi:hypothetical protein
MLEHAKIVWGNQNILSEKSVVLDLLLILEHAKIILSNQNIFSKKYQETLDSQPMLEYTEVV